MSFSFVRHACSSFALVALAIASTPLTGCAVAAEEESENDESAITRALSEGKYQSVLTSSARLRPGYLYRIDIGKKYLGHQYATVYLVSDLCGKQRADKTCDKSFIETNPNSLDKHWNDITIQTAKKTMTFSYEKADPEEGFVTQELSWTYKAAPSGGISLTPKGSRSSFTMAKMPALKKISATLKKDFEKWMDEDLQGDTSGIDSAPSVSLESLPLEAKRIVHYFDVEFSGEYATEAFRIKVKGTSYYALSQGSDGGGYYHFFTMAGAYLGSYGGSESGEWDFDWNE